MAICFHESLPRNGKKLLPDKSEGNAFIVEMPSLEILYYLCAYYDQDGKVLSWDRVKGLVSGWILTKGYFLVNGGVLTIYLPHTQENGWPGGRHAYMQRGLQDDFESDAIRIEIIHV